MIREMMKVIFCSEPLPILGNFCRVLYFMIDPHLHCLGIIPVQRARLIDGNPATHHFFTQPVLCYIRIEPAQNKQMVFYHAKAKNRKCEICRQQFQSAFNPLFAMLKVFFTQKRPPNTSRNAVVIARQAGAH